MKRDDRKCRDSSAISRRSFIKGAVVGAVVPVAGAVGALASVAPASADDAPAELAGVERLGPGASAIDLKINGETKRLTIEPRVTLLRALREHLGLTGTKLVCDRGACGACTVHVDGHPVTSCMMLAVDARGHEITTIEGLGTPANMHPVQAAFVAEDAMQCGFCTPGMVMSIAAALNDELGPDEDDIRRAVAGNICRCGTYPRVFAAAMRVAHPDRGKS